MACEKECHSPKLDPRFLPRRHQPHEAAAEEVAQPGFNRSATGTEQRAIPGRKNQKTKEPILRRLTSAHCLSMVSQKVAALLLVVYVMVLLVERSEGYISFVSHNDATKMKDRERNRVLKKSVNLQPRSEEEGYMNIMDYDNRDEAEIIKLTAPVESGMRVDSKQLQKYQLLLEMLLNEKIPEAQKAD
ncbi:promotilin [Microcaecilia unicolor]|uniref:Promotilin n=1 Tax=Microcaecilia unicolor TaxID=1415580 RepID=A0A6P7ZV96_9AMPH|nr:promotilin [Microcaecilia unicolor]